MKCKEANTFNCYFYGSGCNIAFNVVCFLSPVFPFFTLSIVAVVDVVFVLV